MIGTFIKSAAKGLGIAFLSLFLMSVGSCEKTPVDLSLTLTRTEVSSAGGSIFVQVAASGDWTLETVFSGSEQWATLNKTSGTGSVNNVILTFEANRTEEDRTVTVILRSGGENDSGTLLQVCEASETADDPVEDPDWPGLKSDAPRTWMELPAMTVESGCAWVFHEMTVDGKQMRNYSIYYDAENLCPRWVAYPLNKSLHGSGRNDQWGIYDPKIPQRYQVDLSRSWGSGYDRGHMIPVADRGTSAAKRMTYYPTNITAQASRMNQGIWADLENKIRSWADNSGDTLYVLIGCVPGTRTVKVNKNGMEVNVPEAYYKALLRYDHSSSIGPYLGIAFYIENEDVSGSYADYAMTIDALEEKIGMDLFPNIPDNYVTAAESSINSWWGL